MTKLTLDEFLASTPAMLEAFRAATVENGKTDQSFNRTRDELDWWREVSAYAHYVEFEEASRG